MAKEKMTIPSSKVDIALTAGSTEPAMKSADAKSTKLYRVPIAKIEPIPGFNVRVDAPDYRAHRDMIAASIKANGYDDTKPLAGYVHKTEDGNVIYVTDGHTRLAAVNMLNADTDSGVAIDTLPVVVRTPAPSLTDLTVALHTNNTGRPLTPFELGVVVKRLLKDEGAEKAVIADRLSVTPRYLDDVLLLVNSNKTVRSAVLEGEVSSTLAIQELRKDPEKAAERISAAVAKAKASGKGRATAKDVGVKMRTIKETISVAEGTDMKEIVKAAAAKLRAAIPAEADGDAEDAVKLATVDGTITISIQVPAPLTAKKAKADAEPAAKKGGKKKTAEATSEAKAPKKAGKKKAAAEPAAPEADESETSDDLGIDGAEPAETPVRTDEDHNDPMPPAVKGDATDEEVDI